MTLLQCCAPVITSMWNMTMSQVLKGHAAQLPLQVRSFLVGMTLFVRSVHVVTDTQIIAAMHEVFATIIEVSCPLCFIDRLGGELDLACVVTTAGEVGESLKIGINNVPGKLELNEPIVSWGLGTIG